MQFKFSRLVLSIMFFAVSQFADATPVAFSFSGKITSVQGENPYDLSVGDDFNGLYTFESSTSDACVPDFPVFCNFGARIGRYEDLKGTFTLNVPLAATFTGLNIHVVNDNFGDGYDYYQASGRGIGPGGQTASALLYLIDSSGTALSNDALPLTTPDLNLFNLEHPLGEFSFGEGDSTLLYLFRGDLTEMRCVVGCLPAQVVEPPTIAMAILAIPFALWKRGRRRTTRMLSDVLT